MKNNDLGGVVVPIIVPLDDDERVDEASFRKLIRRLIQNGVHGIFAGGTAGEGPLLTMPEWVRMVEIAYDENKGAVPLLGGVMDTSTRRVLEKIGVLSRIGYRYFVVTPTYYITLKTPDENLRLFGECKEHSDGMEMIAYNIPSTTGSTISVETMYEMGRRGWIRYCKESSEDWHYFTRLVAAGKELGLKVLMGSEPNATNALQAGACGIVPVCANAEPEAFVAAYEASQRGDVAALRRCHERIMYIREALVMAGSCWLAGIKYAVSRQGMGSGKLLSPLQPLTAEEKRRLEERLGLG
ncbi:MAG: dihydrodipicolinate synthase family protein [Anaerolineae bacterium]|nr:dihydrodipicolinate synthase family protein [Anaerolineae bacterium]